MANPIIDGVTIGGTTYDLKDPNLTDEVSELKSALDDSGYGYASKHFSVASGKAHSSNDDQMRVYIPTGKMFIAEVTGVSSCQIWVICSDGTSQRLTTELTYMGVATKDIVRIGVTVSASEGDKNVTVTATVKDSIYDKSVKTEKRKKATTDAIHVLGAELREKIIPDFELGDIVSGVDTASNTAHRMIDYIPIKNVAYFYCGTRSGSLYAVGYNYSDGQYVYVTYNQMVGIGDMTNWIRTKAYTHFRLVWYSKEIDKVSDWLVLKLKTNLSKLNAYENIDFGKIDRTARDLLIDILKNSVYSTNVSGKITQLERHLIENGELIIKDTGKRYTQSGAIGASENHCITEIYPIPEDESKIAVYMAVDDLTKTGSPFIIIRDSDDTLASYINMGNSGRQNVEYTHTLQSTHRYIGFTLITESAQKSYAYFVNSGKLIFAGSESRYAGLKNIIQKGVEE